MNWLITKYLVTAAVVVAVSEAAKRSDRFGGLIAALPLVTLLTLIWLRAENQSSEKIANHAWYTFWYVVPTLPMFLAFPALMPYRLLAFNGRGSSPLTGDGHSLNTIDYPVPTAIRMR